MDNMKSCPQCGKANGATTKFCNQCGYQFPVAPAAPVVNEQPAAAPVPPVNPAPAAPVVNEQPAAAPVTPVNPAPAAPVANEQPAAAPVAPVNPAPAAPVVNEQPAAAPVTPVNPAPAAPVVNEQPAAAPVTPVNPTPAAPMNNGFQQPGMGMPPMGQPGMNMPPMNNVAVAPSYVTGTNGASGEKKKGKGGLVAVIIIICLLIVAALGVLAVIIFQEDNVLELDATELTVHIGEEETLSIINYLVLDKPELVWSVEDESIVSVEEGKGGKFTLEGLEEGETVLTISTAPALFGLLSTSEEYTCTIIVKEPIELEVEGSAWETDDGIEYYFMEDGTFYEIYSAQENYIKGQYSVEEMDLEEAEDEIGADNVEALLAEAEDGVFYALEIEEEEDIYNGGYSTTENFVFMICYNGEDAAIYDAGWGVVSGADDISMEDADTLENNYFASAPAEPEPDTGTTTTTPDTSVTSGTVPGTNFPGENHSGWYMSGDNGYFITDIGGDIYGISNDDLLSGAAPERIVDVDGSLIRLVMSGDKIFYSIETNSGNAQLCMATLDGQVTVLDDGYAASTIIVENDMVYYTDYSSLRMCDFSGNIQEIWEYSTFAYDVDDTYVYVFDGYTWEVLDAYTGEDLGYVHYNDYAYEVDVVRMCGDYLFYVMYDDYTVEVTAYAMDLDGNRIQLGNSHYGLNYDTYMVAFYENYIFYTANDREDLVRVDVTTGEEVVLNFYEDVDYNYWYANDLQVVNDQLVMYMYDFSNMPLCVAMDIETFEVTELNNISY